MATGILVRLFDTRMNQPRRWIFKAKKIYKSPTIVVNSYPHFWKLCLIGVERNEDLIAQFMAKVLPKHFDVLGLDVK